MDKVAYERLWKSSEMNWEQRLLYSPSIFSKGLNENTQTYPQCECVYFPLEKTLENYGFLETDIVTTAGPKTPRKFDLNSRSLKLYRELCNADQMPATRYAQLVANIVNYSMCFEFSIIKNKHRVQADTQEVVYYEEAEKSYRPPKDFTLRGICEDSQFFMEKVIMGRIPQYPYRIAKASISDGSLAAHSVILFYSDKRWTLLNCLSPTNPEPLLAKESLHNSYITFNDGPISKGKIILP